MIYTRRFDSIFGLHDTPTATQTRSFGHYCFTKDNSFSKESYTSAGSPAKTWNSIKDHTYFVYVICNEETVPSLSDRLRFIAYKGDGTSGSVGNVLANATCILNKMICGTFTATETRSGCHMNFYTEIETTYGLTMGGIIDLTYYGLDEMDAQSFATKYYDHIASACKLVLSSVKHIYTMYDGSIREIHHRQKVITNVLKHCDAGAYSPTDDSKNAIYFSINDWIVAGNYNNLQYFETIINHKYAFISKAELDPNATNPGSVRGYDVQNYNLSTDNVEPILLDSNLWGAKLTSTKNSHSNINWYRSRDYHGTHWNPNDIIHYGVLIDLTANGIENLTLQEVYSRYKTYIEDLSNDKPAIIISY